MQVTSQRHRLTGWPWHLIGRNSVKWSFQSRGFHLITSWQKISNSPFALAPFFALSLICLSYINKSFVIKISYLLPRAKLLRVNFLMKGGYLLPRGKFKLPHFPNQAHYHPRICTQQRSSHIDSIHKKSSDFIQGNFAYLSFICAVWSSRGYLLPLSHRECDMLHGTPTWWLSE